MSKTSDTTAMPLARGLLGQFFGNEDGRLTIGGVSVDTLAEQHGTPFYAYDLDVMRARFRSLSNAVTGFAQVYFSVKANPREAVARAFLQEGAGLEIASKGEMELALKAGCEPKNILFAGPGKGRDELEFCIKTAIGEIHLETYEEIVHVSELAQQYKTKVDVAIRVNPIADVQGGAMRMGGKPTAFGFDEEILDDVLESINSHPNLNLTGLHLFAGTQILSYEVLLKQWEHGLNLANTLAEKMGRPLKTVDLGGGLGVPYHQKHTALDLAALAKGVPALKRHQDSLPLIANARVIIEPGRYLTAPAGIYVTSVRAVKYSRGARFIITDGGMHHHLAASGNLGQVIKRDYPILAANKLDDHDLKQASIVGPLCTPLDTYGRKTDMPDMQQGDKVAVLQSGAYGLTASPVGFLSHPLPAEIFLGQGKITSP